MILFQSYKNKDFIDFTGGWGGIRTHGEREPTPVFKTGALNHSATHPLAAAYREGEADSSLLGLVRHCEERSDAAIQLWMSRCSLPRRLQPCPGNMATCASSLRSQ